MGIPPFIRRVAVILPDAGDAAGAEGYEGEQPSCFSEKNKIKNKKMREPRSMRASSPHVFLFFLPPAASVSPLECDKVTDLDLVKNAQRIFP